MNSAGMQYLESRLMFGMVPGLESTFKICEALGNPQESFRTIHVVGTNGKGSCSYYLAGVLQAHGLKTGLYTSPHLISLRERIRVNDTPVSDADLDRLFLQVKAAAETARVEPTFFEVVTVATFLYYREQGVQVAVTVKQKGEKDYKISLRTTDEIDASAVCAALGGGGHRAAAGCSFSGSLEEAVETIVGLSAKAIESAAV